VHETYVRLVQGSARKGNIWFRISLVRTHVRSCSLSLISHGTPEHDTAVYPFPFRKNIMSSPLEYPPELLSLICAYVYVASIPSRVSSLDPLCLMEAGIPTGLPSSYPPSSWSEPIQSFKNSAAPIVPSLRSYFHPLHRVTRLHAGCVKRVKAPHAGSCCGASAMLSKASWDVTCMVSERSFVLFKPC